MSIYIDISEFVGNPIRTGIQRVVRELICYWPTDVAVRLCAYSPTGDMFYELPDRTVRLALDGAGDDIDVDELKKHIEASDTPERRRRLGIGEGQHLLVPEVFYDPARIDAYRRLAQACDFAPSVIVHDFAAYFHPDAFKITATGSNFFLPYLYFVRSAAARTFTSDLVADQYAYRISRSGQRSSSDTVLRLGADGLRLARQNWDERRRTMVCIGSFDGKKHQNILFEAFQGSERLQQAFDLLFIGRRPEAWQGSVFAPIFAGGHYGIRVLEHASDSQLREAFTAARASVFIGTYEGYGLPAVESLFSGVPLIAWSGLPALSGLSTAGQLRIREVSVASVRAALESMIDHEVAAALWRQAEELRLESWAGYARKIADWMMT